MFYDHESNDAWEERAGASRAGPDFQDLFGIKKCAECFLCYK